MFRDDLRTDIKLVHHELDKGIEVESFLKPVQNAYNGKEIVVMIRSQHVVNNDLVFHTDSNGYYMQKRKLNHRDDFEPNNQVPIPSNYYPVTSAFYIEDTATQARLTVMTDRSQGVTCLLPGEMEIMIHRLTVNDDWKGLSETLNEQDPDGGLLQVSTRHYLVYSSPSMKYFYFKKQFSRPRSQTSTKKKTI